MQSRRLDGPARYRSLCVLTGEHQASPRGVERPVSEREGGGVPRRGFTAIYLMARGSRSGDSTAVVKASSAGSGRMVSPFGPLAACMSCSIHRRLMRG